MVKTKVVKELAKELFTLYSGRVNSALSQAINSDETSISRVDSKGYVVDDKTIYEAEVSEVKEPVKLDDIA
jgi:hypothetical protein